ncbi:MAG: virginiamycin B lyase family protein, partial [Nitrososphaerales archaeon]
MNKILIGVAVAVIVTAAILTYTSNLFFKQQQIPADKLTNSSLYCGSGVAKSNEYIKEYVITTECSQPLGIIVDESGHVWFAESSARKIAKFDPVKESFEEFALPDANAKKDFATSGIWSMIFDANRDIWFSDVGSNAIWKFYRTTQTFEKYEIPTQKSFPLGLVMDENG